MIPERVGNGAGRKNWVGTEIPFLVGKGKRSGFLAHRRGSLIALKALKIELFEFFFQITITFVLNAS